MNYSLVDWVMQYFLYFLKKSVLLSRAIFFMLFEDSLVPLQISRLFWSYFSDDILQFCY